MVGRCKNVRGFKLKIKLTPKREVFNFCKPYIIAEIASNHNGDMELAKKLIISAKKAGADCVKFQSWSKETIFSSKVYKDNYFLGDDYRKRTDYTLEDIVEKFSMSEQDLLKMKKFSEEVGIDFASTPFSEKEVDFLVDKLGASFIKVASMDVNNYPFLKYIAKKGLPVVLSTGLSELREIDKAIKTIESCGNKRIVILHCISSYPPKDKDVDLNCIDTFRRTYPYPIGFSDHTLGFVIPLAAIAKGACIVEKHFTLDKTLFGWDHKISATPDELKIICGGSARINSALGTGKITCKETKARKIAFKRSIVTTRDIKKGETIGKKDITLKRPGSGMEPQYFDFVIGRKAKRNLKRDEVIKSNDI